MSIGACKNCTRDIYEIIVENPHHLNCGNSTVALDGVAVSSSEISLVDDGCHYKVSIVIEAKKA